VRLIAPISSQGLGLLDDVARSLFASILMCQEFARYRGIRSAGITRIKYAEIKRPVPFVRPLYQLSRPRPRLLKTLRNSFEIAKLRNQWAL
jgi:hypothetical protein